MIALPDGLLAMGLDLTIEVRRGAGAAIRGGGGGSDDVELIES